MKHFKKKLIILALISSGAMAGISATAGGDGRASSMEDLEAASGGMAGIGAVAGEHASSPSYNIGYMTEYWWRGMNQSSSTVWDGYRGYRRSKAESKGLILKSDLGYEPFISNTSSPTQDGVVSTEGHAVAGFSLGYEDVLLNGAYGSLSFVTNDDEAYMVELDYSYSVAVGPGSFTFGVGYAESEDGDETLMEEGFTGMVGITMGHIGLSFGYNEGNDYDDQEKISISYAVGDLTIGVGYSEISGIGENKNDVYVTSGGATYDMGGGMVLTVGGSHTDGYDTGSSQSVDEDAVYAKVSFRF